MRKLSLLLCMLILCSTVCCGSMGAIQLLDDREFFEVLNLDHPGLEQVKKSVESGDYSVAKHQYVDYLKKRTKPVWFFDWHDFAPPAAKDRPARTYHDIYADRYCNNEMLAHGTWYKFGDKIDWSSNHSDNNYDEWTWQLNRHYCWQTLGSVYWKTGDEKYARAFARQINEWIDQCEMPLTGWQKAGSTWRTFESGLRMQETWMDAFHYFLPSKSFDDESIVKMVKSIYQHAIHLRTHHTSNNFLSVEMNGLYTVGAMFPEFKEAEEWRDFAVKTLYEEEKNQFYPDGAQVELAPGYHTLAQSNIVALYRMAKLNKYPLPKDFISRLEATYEYYQKLMLPDGTLPAVNDSRWVEAEKYLKEAYELFPDRKDYRFFATNWKQGRKPKYTSVWMPWAGWYVMRSGWDKEAMYAFFEVGPYGAAHQHEDKLSFILYAYGNRLITECGTYAYDATEWRKYTTSARGHNVARVDGQDQNRNALRSRDDIKQNTAPMDNVWKSTRSYDYGEGEYTEGYGTILDNTVTHKRSIRFVKNKYWIVTDTFTPSDETVHTYDTWFHFNTSNYGIDEKLGIVYSADLEKANIAIVHLGGNGTVSVVTGQETPEIQGWLPASGGENGFHCEPAATPVYHCQEKGVVTETYLFIPFNAGEQMPVKEVMPVSKNKYQIRFVNGKRYTYLL